MSESSARVGVASRHALAVFWGFFAVACMGLVLLPKVRNSAWFFLPPIGGGALLLSAWGYYRGRRWSRVALGVVVAPLSLLCFDRLLYYYFARRFGLPFWSCLCLLATAFYTWVLLFAGLDRDAPPDHDGWRGWE
jgi:hypothetical protein